MFANYKNINLFKYPCYINNNDIIHGGESSFGFNYNEYLVKISSYKIDNIFYIIIVYMLVIMKLFKTYIVKKKIKTNSEIFSFICTIVVFIVIIILMCIYY